MRSRGEKQEQEPQAELAHDKQPSTSTDIMKPQHRQWRIWRWAEKKPIGIIAYNKGKIGIDISDQMASYEMALRKGIKQYQKLAISLFTGIAITNAWVIYKKTDREKHEAESVQRKYCTFTSPNT